MSKTIRTISGFILPENDHFKQQDYMNRLTERFPSLKNKSWDGTWYSSDEASHLHRQYLTNPCFETYMGMVNLLVDIFKDNTFVKFLTDQVDNVHLSPLGFELIVALGGDVEYSDFDFTLYSSVPTFLSPRVDVTSKEFTSRKKRLNDSLSFFGKNASQQKRLQSLISNRKAFAATFRFILTNPIESIDYA